MVDREKVIKTLTDALTAKENYPWARAEMSFEFIEMLLELLKEQEAVEPKQVDLYGNDEWWGLVCICPDCKAEWMSDKADTHFCPKCGRKVKWE